MLDSSDSSGVKVTFSQRLLRAGSDLRVQKSRRNHEKCQTYSRGAWRKTRPRSVPVLPVFVRSPADSGFEMKPLPPAGSPHRRDTPPSLLSPFSRSAFPAAADGDHDAAVSEQPSVRTPVARPMLLGRVSLVFLSFPFPLFHSPLLAETRVRWRDLVLPACVVACISSV
jgi:hypothetical protein